MRQRFWGWRTVSGRLGLALALATVALSAVCPMAAVAQSTGEGEPEPLYSKERAFRIPFNLKEESDRARIKEVQLFVSTDLGQSWKRAAQTTPEQLAFPAFKPPRDAEYWFAVRTLDLKGRLYPTDDAEVVPSMKVVVDTTPPTIQIAPMGRRGERAQVHLLQQQLQCRRAPFPQGGDLSIHNCHADFCRQMTGLLLGAAPEFVFDLQARTFARAFIQAEAKLPARVYARVVVIKRAVVRVVKIKAADAIAIAALIRIRQQQRADAGADDFDLPLRADKLVFASKFLHIVLSRFSLPLISSLDSIYRESAIVP